MLPSSVVIVIVAVPPDTAVINPVLDTVATFVSLELQVTTLFVALFGSTVAVNCCVFDCVLDIFNVILVLSKITPVTDTTSTGLTSFHSPRPVVSEKLAS